MNGLQTRFHWKRFAIDRDSGLCPSLEPSYKILKGCLTWSDESPFGLTPDGYGELCDLWIARSLLHKGLTLADHPLAPKYCEDLFQRAIHQVSSWPGFQRLTLCEKDLAYYEHENSDQFNPTLMASCPYGQASQN